MWNTEKFKSVNQYKQAVRHSSKRRVNFTGFHTPVNSIFFSMSKSALLRIDCICLVVLLTNGLFVCDSQNTDLKQVVIVHV